jgi:hypothetical protein
MLSHTQGVQQAREIGLRRTEGGREPGGGHEMAGLRASQMEFTPQVQKGNFHVVESHVRCQVSELRSVCLVLLDEE